MGLFQTRGQENRVRHGGSVNRGTLLVKEDSQDTFFYWVQKVILEDSDDILDSFYGIVFSLVTLTLQ